MARHVNTQYMLFKQNLQNRFAERYRRDTAPNYSQQDVEHLKLIHPEIPEPIIPAARSFRPFPTRKGIQQQIALDTFEQEYEEFIAKLKADKKAKEESEQEQVEPVVEETAPVVEEPVVEDVVETPVVEETKPTKKKKGKSVEEHKDELPMFDLT
jgi:hypothetical protein